MFIGNPVCTGNGIKCSNLIKCLHFMTLDLLYIHLIKSLDDRVH